LSNSYYFTNKEGIKELWQEYIYCNTCASHMRAAKKRHQKPKRNVYLIRHCLKCGNEFQTATSSWYCGMKCRIEAEKERNKKSI
jgi:hypothetical protein